MRCLTNEELTEYVLGTTLDTEQEMVYAEHLALCMDCLRRARKIAHIDSTISEWDPDSFALD